MMFPRDQSYELLEGIHRGNVGFSDQEAYDMFVT